MTGSLRAQVGGHPTAGDPVPANLLFSPEQRLSPLMNQPDGYWNLGEAAVGVLSDRGGTLAPVTKAELESSLTLGNITTLQSWTTKTGSQNKIVHFFGRLRRDGVPPQGLGEEVEADFEILVPASFVAGSPKPTLLVLSAFQTLASVDPAKQVFDPHVYPGLPYTSGRLQADVPFPYPDGTSARFFDQGSAKPYQVACAYVVPRTSLRPLNFSLQRVRELRRAAMLLLNQHFQADLSKFEVMVGGGSFGCFVAQVAVIMHPDEFHGATASAYSASHRALINDFDRNVLVTSLLAEVGSAHEYTLRDAVDFSIYCRRELTNFESLGFLSRLRRGHVQRPFYFLVGDEDPVTHGNEWVHGIADSTPGAAYPYTGKKSWPTATGPNVDVFWSVVGKACHGDAGGDPYFIDGDTTPHVDPLDAAWFMLDQVHAEAQSNRVVYPPGSHALIPRIVTGTGGLTTLEPYDEGVLNRKAQRTVPPVSQPVIAPDPSFQTFGGGTWTGANDSVRIHRVGDEGSGNAASVYVGSAEGVITRYRRAAVTVGSTVHEPFVVAARSNTGGTTPQDFSLGYGVFALDVGSISGGAPDLVAAAYRRLGCFDAATLAWKGSYDLPDWEDTNPRRLQLVDVLGPSTDKEVVFRTSHGRISIYQVTSTPTTATFQKAYDFEENGVVDFVFVPGAPLTSGVPNPVLKTPLFALSARGHVLKLELGRESPSGPVKQYLTALSRLQYGRAWDLDVVSIAGTSYLAAMFTVDSETSLKSLRVFRTDTLDLHAEFANIQNPAVMNEAVGTEEIIEQNAPAPSVDLQGGLAILGATTGTPRYAVLTRDRLGIWDYGSNLASFKNLTSFAPAKNATAIAVGEIDGVAGEDLVLATASGRVVWFKANEIDTPTTALGVVHTPVWDASAKLVVNRANASVASTWALTLGRDQKLQAVDPVGTWWSVDPASGQPTWRMDLPIVNPRAIVDVRGQAGAWGPSGVSSGVGKFDFSPATGALKYGPYALFRDAPALPRIWQEIDLSDLWFIPTIDSYAILPQGGDMRVDGANSKLAWWEVVVRDPDLISTLSVDLSLSTPVATSLAASTGQPPSGNDPRPPRVPATGLNVYLRAEIDSDFAPFQWQALRLGRFAGNAGPQIVATAMGARPILLDGTSATKRGEGPDCGYGGIALAVGNLDDDAEDEVLFAPLHDPVSGLSQPPRPTLRAFEAQATGNPTFQQIAALTLTGPGDIAAFGVCGLEIVDFGQGENRRVYIVVATVQGELLVYEWSLATKSFGALRYTAILEGAIGAYNAIVSADLAPVDGKPELYVATARGLRKWTF